jgi:hypothetical protein
MKRHILFPMAALAVLIIQSNRSGCEFALCSRKCSWA